MSTCEHCSKIIQSLKQELAAKDEQLERLSMDIQALNQKYVAEIERVGNIQHEKDLVEHELEELSQRLFEEANEMVAAEKRARYQLENELRQTQEHLVAEKTQLHELRLRLLSADQATEEMHDEERKKRQNKAKSMPVIAKKSPFDDIQLELFREFVDSKQLTIKKLNQTSFMKYCLNEDIEPCLRFGPQSKLSTKKMIDSFSRQPCFIEHINATDSMPPSPSLWNRLSNKSNLCCSACGRSSSSICTTSEQGQRPQLNYRFRLNEQDNWLLIDQYCRDRLVAVCNFFVFVRNIQLGLYSDRSIHDLYAENIRLRLQMFYSRMGALPVLLNSADDDAIDQEDPYLSDNSSLAGPNTPKLPPSPLANQCNLDTLIK
ncbi:hypothetical protein RMATCC62417_02530 [Rhizopus microsporus]|nr:hypothetical protein RMATCC62417_02530 [Rhizopus microsporus]